jgi:hypothetical protein
MTKEQIQSLRELIQVLQELRKLFPRASQPEPWERDLPYFVGN